MSSSGQRRVSSSDVVQPESGLDAEDGRDVDANGAAGLRHQATGAIRSSSWPWTAAPGEALSRTIPTSSWSLTGVSNCRAFAAVNGCVAERSEKMAFATTGRPGGVALAYQKPESSACCRTHGCRPPTGPWSRDRDLTWYGSRPSSNPPVNTAVTGISPAAVVPARRHWCRGWLRIEMVSGPDQISSTDESSTCRLGQRPRRDAATPRMRYSPRSPCRTHLLVRSQIRV